MRYTRAMIPNIVLTIFTFLLLGVGLLGVFVPFLPGVPLAWFAVFLYALLTDFATISLTTVLILLGVTLLTVVVDIIAPLIGAKRHHATRHGLLGASIGFFLGMFLFPPVGIIIGPFAGAFVGEVMGGKKAGRALESARGTFIGFLAGVIFKIVAVLVIAGFFIASLFS